MEKNEILISTNTLEETRNTKQLIGLYLLIKFVANGLFRVSLFVLFSFLLYEIKSDLGIDIFPGWSPFH